MRFYEMMNAARERERFSSDAEAIASLLGAVIGGLLKWFLRGLALFAALRVVLG